MNATIETMTKAELLVWRQELRDMIQTLETSGEQVTARLAFAESLRVLHQLNDRFPGWQLAS